MLLYLLSNLSCSARSHAFLFPDSFIIVVPLVHVSSLLYYYIIVFLYLSFLMDLIAEISLECSTIEFQQICEGRSTTEKVFEHMRTL